MDKPQCKLIGENGNVFNLIGITKKTLRRAGLKGQMKRFDKELSDITCNGGSYDDVLGLIQRYVEVV